MIFKTDILYLPQQLIKHHEINKRKKNYQKILQQGYS